MPSSSKAPKVPARLRKGPAGQVNAYNALLDFAISLQIKPGVNYEPSRSADGTELISLFQAIAAGAKTVYDFTLTPATSDSDSDGGGAAVRLGFGNVTGNGINLKSGVKPYPQEFSADNTPPWTDTKAVTGSPTQLWYAYLVITVDPHSGGDSDSADDGSGTPEITSISWDTYTEPQTNSDDGTTGYILLGTGYVSADGKTATVLNSTGIGSQTVGYCGTTFYFDPIGPVIES